MIPLLEEIKGRDQCKWHDSTHSTNHCVVFWDEIEDNIDKGYFKFVEKEKEVTMMTDTNHFPSTVIVNYQDKTFKNMI